MIIPPVLLKNIRVKSIVVEVRPEATLEQCKAEAATLSLDQLADVEFTFKGVEYIVGYELLLNAVKELK